MKANAPGILLATVLVFLARALFFQKEIDPISNSLIAAAFGIIGFILRYGVKYVAKPFGKVPDTETLSTKWTSNLVLGCILALVLVNIDGLSNMYLGTPSVPNFLLSPFFAAVVIALFATILTLVKSAETGAERIPYPWLYATTSLIVNSFLIFGFVYAR